ncbi:hypothetical protein AVEN_111136-1 [Araneus ventricosus]|uniref:Uncharacterized protein n=1 Tax=Araneus ventricosus TaxID=182803 RepID=A0A4Y2C8L6_ARAVE|nr:hypothetical protein AVEN_111136-1 [Araneus ventricosus]
MDGFWHAVFTPKWHISIACPCACEEDNLKAQPAGWMDFGMLSLHHISIAPVRVRNERWQKRSTTGWMDFGMLSLPKMVNTSIACPMCMKKIT